MVIFLTLSGSGFLRAGGPGLRDIAGDRAEAAIRTLVADGVVHGYRDGTFRPDRAITRAEFTKMVAASSKIPLVDLTQYENCFPDVRNEWFSWTVCLALEQGWLEGYPDGLFRPERTISKAEALKILMTAYEIDLTFFHDLAPYWDVRDGDWYNPYIRSAVYHGLLSEPGPRYFPEHLFTRRAAAELLYRVLQSKAIY